MSDLVGNPEDRFSHNEAHNNVGLFQARRISLEDAGKLFKFYRECDEFETWMKEKVSETGKNCPILP